MKALLERELRRLGRTADDVAESLTKLGHYGHQGDASDCPLARFGQRVFEVAGIEVEGIVVTRGALTVWTKGPADSFVETCVTLPCGVGEFVAFYDGGCFPHLILSCSDKEGVA